MKTCWAAKWIYLNLSENESSTQATFFHQTKQFHATFNTRHNRLQFKCMLLELHVRTTCVGKVKQAKNDILNRKYSKWLLK